MKVFRVNMRAYADAAKRAGYGYTKVAASAGYSKGHWSDLMSGKIPNPSILAAARVALAYRVTVNDLLTGDAEAQRKIAAKVEKSFRRKGIEDGE